MHVITKSRIVHQGWSTLHVAMISRPDGGEFTREIEDHGSAVCVLPYNRQRKAAVLIRQFRAPVLFAGGQQDMLEAIAGILDEAEPAEAARRETTEEAGLALNSLEPLFVSWTMPGLSTERMHFYFATYDEPPRESARGLPHQSEVTIPVEISLSELAASADAGTLTDMKTLLVLQTLRLRKPELFAA